MNSRSILFSFVGHLVILGALFIVGSLTGKTTNGPKVYNVSIVAGVVGPGGTGGGGRPGVPLTGMAGQPGKIGGQALPRAEPLKGTALVDEVKRRAASAKKPKADSGRAGNPDQIALRVYGQGGTIGGGPGGDSTGGGIGGRPASAYEVAMNSKILANWNENLWKASPNRLSCTIQFLIAGDGKITNARVFESSGNEGFDQASKRAIELALMPAPLDFGIPGNLHEARVTFVNRPE